LEENPLLRPVLDAIEEGVFLLDEAGAVRCMNAAAERLLGYREDELLGRPFLTCLELAQEGGAPHSGAGAAFDWRPALGQGSARFRRKDGCVLGVVCALQPLGRDAAGPALLKFRERERGQAGDIALRDIETKLHAIFDTVADGLIVIGESGAIQLFTAGAERLFGYRQDEVLGQNVKMLMPSPYREAHDGYLATYLGTGIKKIIGTGREVSGRRKNGTVFPLYLSIGEMHLDGRHLFAAIIHDLTGRKRAEEQLLMLSAAVDQSPAAVLITALDGQIEYVNQAFTHLTGYGAGELAGQNPRLLQSGHTAQEKYQRLWETILVDGREWRDEIQDRKKNGELYWALETITPLRNTQGEITHYLAVQQDITGQKQDKEALAESEARFRQVAEMAGEWLWEQDPEGHYIYSSGALRNILGFTSEEIRGKHYLDLLTAEDRKHWVAALPFPSSGIHQPFHRLINHYRHKDGHEVYTESTGAPIFNEQGELIKWRGVDHDITARKAFEDALRVRDRAIEASHAGIVITDAQVQGNPNIYVNPALSRITGYSREELLRQNMRLLQGPDTDPAAVEQIRQAIDTGRSCEVVLKNYRKGGAPFWNELLISPVVDDTGKLTHYIGIQTDVTERRRAEEDRHELEIAKHIQLSLLPDSPLRLPGAELAGVCVPASHVGGDYFDFFHASGDVDAVIADVSGHSVGAALIMAEVRSTLRAETRKVTGVPVGPAQVLRALNDLLYDDLTRAELFITMFYLKYLSDTRTLKYANAGHNWALLLRLGDAACTPLDAEGLVLGVWREVDFEERSIELAAGDRLLLYTDGVTEAETPQGTFFGYARLCALFSAYRTLPPEALIEKLLAEVRAFCGKAPLRDDISMVMLQVR
jgi:sigma-B regulation protein RsbU (phosphoserine phosphatase)